MNICIITYSNAKDIQVWNTKIKLVFQGTGTRLSENNCILLNENKCH